MKHTSPGNSPVRAGSRGDSSVRHLRESSIGNGPDGDAIEQLGRELAREMRRRWRRDSRWPVEAFLDKHPELQRRPEAAIELVYEEYCLRLTDGESGVEQDMLRRFPQWVGPLRVMFDCHRALQSERDLPKLPAVGDTIGEFRLLAELGRGSRGRVFLATQSGLADRPVVVKVTPLDGGEHLSLARVQHTNIVPLHSVVDDAARGIRILCMPCFGRATLASLLRPPADQPGEREDSQPVSWRPVQLAARTGQYIVDAIDRVQEPSSLAAAAGAARQMLAHVSYVRAMCWIAACLADALEFAHERGLVHLDLKPSNVLLASDGQPMLLDFHLAREPIRPGAPLPEDFGGTPGYMPPEQQAAIQSLQNGRSVESVVDGRADIYALGAMLYESLGGHLPIAADSPPLSIVNPQVSLGLSDIVAKCVARRPEDRYSSAGALADDLRRHCSDQPLVGVPNRSLAERWYKWRRRRPNTLRAGAMLAVVGMAAAMLIAGTWFQWRDRREQAERALQFGTDVCQSGGQVAEAVQTMERGLAMAEHLPFQRKLQHRLRDQIDTARRIQIAQQLNELADEIRVVYGTDFIAPARLQFLTARCRDFWAKRALIANALGAMQGPDASSDRGNNAARGVSSARAPGVPHIRDTKRYDYNSVSTDLLDIAVFAADLQVKSSEGLASIEARRESLRILDEAEAMFGTSAVVEYERGVHRRALGLIEPEDLSEATSWTKSAAPRTAWEHYALGRAFLASDDLPHAAAELTAALERDPAGRWPNFYYGLCAYRMGRYEDAVAAFSVCIGAAPNLAGCFYNRALALAALGRTDRALRDYDRALELDPAHAAAALNRGMLHYAQGQLDSAVANLRLALQHGADPATVHYNLALVHIAAQDPAALDDVQRALQLNPAHDSARLLRDKLQNDLPRRNP